MTYDETGKDWELDFALASLPWCYLDSLQVAVEKIPSLALIAGSQNPLGHLGVGLMKSKVTPAFSTQSIALSGIGLRDEQSTASRLFIESFISASSNKCPTKAEHAYVGKIR